MAIINTNNSQIPFIDFDDQSRVFKFEYGTQLVEYVYMLSAEVSAPLFLGNLSTAINNNSFPEFLEESVNNMVLLPYGNTGTLSAPMLLALKTAATPNPSPSSLQSLQSAG